MFERNILVSLHWAIRMETETPRLYSNNGRCRIPERGEKEKNRTWKEEEKITQEVERRLCSII